MARFILLILAAILYISGGSFHFLIPQQYLKIMPEWVPKPLLMVYISGAAEIAGGLGLLLPQTRRYAAWALVLLLIAVFPANVHMAAHNIQVTATPIPQRLLWARLALQPILIWWVLWCTREV